MYLPSDDKLAVEKLAIIFRDTTNSYKYYWFLALLDEVAISKRSEITFNHLIGTMFDKVWYPLTYYKLSFGKQDSFRQIADFVQNSISIDNSANSKPVSIQIQESDEQTYKLIQRELKTLIRWVPFRFLRPFLFSETQNLSDSEVNHKIKALSKPGNSDKVLYFLNSDNICINPLWIDYLTRNYEILKGFTYWHLVKFLQRNNPLTIGIAEKLFKPVSRDLVTQRKAWADYYRLNGGVSCIYTSRPVNIDFSLDHFIPWSFVVHDFNWNLLPVNKEVNSKKSDRLPSLEKYLNLFCELQHDFFKTTFNISNHLKSLEAYQIIFQSPLSEIDMLTKAEFKNTLSQTIRPLEEMARNCGFVTMGDFKHLASLG